MKSKQYGAQLYALLIAQFLGALNDNAFKNAFIILITFSLAESAGVSVQIFVVLAGAVFILPFFLFSSTTGQICDKYAKDKVMQWTKFLEIIIMLSALAALHWQNIYLLLFVLFLLGLQSTIFSPAKYAVLPELIAKNQLVRGNGQLNALTFMAILMGTIMGGEIILLNHGIWILGTVMILFAIVGWIISLKVPKLVPKDSSLIINWNFLSTTKAMVASSHVFSRRKLLCEEKSALAKLILSISWFWFVGASYLSLLAPFAKDVLNGDERLVTILLTSFALGVGIGSVLCNKIAKRFPSLNLVSLGLVLMALFGFEIFMAVTLSTPGNVPLWTIILGFVGIAMAAGIYVVPLETQLQILAPDQTRARIIASMNIVNAMFMVLSALLLMLASIAGLSIVQSFLIISCVNLYFLWRENQKRKPN